MLSNPVARSVVSPAGTGTGAWQGWWARPGVPVALGLLLFGVVWLTHLSYTSLSPPTDNIEQLTWVHSLEGGYYKHPPLPTWLFWLPAQLFGVNAWTSYATGAAFTLGAMGVLWRLLSILRGDRYATLALLAALCVTYYNGRLYYYNHNVVLMFFVAASAALCWKAHQTGRAVWWIALGGALGLGALSKYQIAVTMVCVIVFWLHQRGWRDPSRRCGLLLAALVALLVFVPHVWWLREHDFGPIHYAMETSLGSDLGLLARWTDSLHWVADQLLNRAMPAWVLLACMAYALRRRNALPAQEERDGEPVPIDAARALLLSWGLVPLLFMPLVGLLGGAELQLQWGTPFLLFAIPAAMELASPWVAWSRTLLRPAMAVFGAIQVLLLLLSHITSPRGPQALQDHHWRTFDSEALARLLQQPARAALGGKICLVTGPAALAGALALELSDRPKVLIDGRYDYSPWVPPELIVQCGALELNRGTPLPGGSDVGPAFPNLSWRARPRL